MLRLLLPAEIERRWEEIGRALNKAFARDETRQAIDVYRDLQTGDMALFEANLPGISGFAVVEIDEPRFWIVYIGGKIAAPRGTWPDRVRVMSRYFAGIARAHDCTEIRIEGRKGWARVFPDWERLAERPGRNELRKVL